MKAYMQSLKIWPLTSVCLCGMGEEFGDETALKISIMTNSELKRDLLNDGC